MGVKDLWKLLETTGRPVTLESLEGLVLAVGEAIFLDVQCTYKPLFVRCTCIYTCIFIMYAHPLTLCPSLLDNVHLVALQHLSCTS